MKVIRLSTFLDYGGIESKMVKIAGRDSQDVEFIYVSLGRGGEAERKIKSKGRRVICLGIDHRIPSLAAIVGLCKLFKTEKPDVVHCAGAEANFHGVVASKLMGVKSIVVEEIGIPAQSRVAKSVFSLLYSVSSCVVVESRYVARYLRAFYRNSKFRLKVVNNFIEPPGVRAKNLQGKGVKKFLSVSRLEPVKGIDKVLYAFARLREEGFCFKYDVVGSGSQESYLSELVGQLGLIGFVELHGFKNNVEDFYQSSDFFILNSVSEGASNSLLEALAYGLPSITTEVGSAEDLVRGEANGWLVKSNDSEEVYKSIKLALKLDSDTYFMMSKYSIESIQTGFSFQDYLDALRKIYLSTS
ncbi:glycosyltransferase [Marinobacter sp. TBZ242]|uniref:Glycosyltransferase n=1 Tax=Marinobacter azerbaijanicus TaxID=3050455 RepID=A0ABT7IE96_9GAMM|nr:glycosyltransferase [Marinobacter sp. TBZ242]MDL0431985.1 glycosyltransferase [Marinobacter sp. TBZ242]